MYEMTYWSSASPDLRDEDIPVILEKAREFNSTHNITGCLLYHKRRFVQMLEGEKEVVQALYSKIAQDPRHSDILLLAEGYKDERVFAGWSMAYYQLSKGEVLDEKLFIDNFITFSDLTRKSTFSSLLFWGAAKNLLEK
ncbi:BLUF domain-containing protein [Telluribacter humicola]|uniref:BLUF domain-containing protein n=1 Tax=Telluribacter humicola TaxID=1720261 RepID=UPI001A9579BC|nr:BLUF domain-containing protein [Telluribacter humicola]